MATMVPIEKDGSTGTNTYSKCVPTNVNAIAKNASSRARLSRTALAAGQQQRHEAQREEVKRRDDIVFAAKSKAQVRSNQHKTYRAADQTGRKQRARSATPTTSSAAIRTAHESWC